MTFDHDQLRAARIKRGMTREQLAVAVGRSYNSIGSYERGEAEPTASVLAMIAVVLRLPIDYFFDNVQPFDRKEKNDDQ